MKRRSKAGGKSAKAQPGESLKLKPDTVPKAAAGRSSAMQELAHWLESLGMSEYARRFAENDIDLSVLPDLTDQDLRELGLSMGHRRRLLRAISELNNTSTSPNVIAKSAPPPISASEPPPSGAATVAPVAEAAGERRHVTVMFCDLVDSTGIVSRLDAEEWRDLVGAYLDAASAAVTEMGGHVAKKLRPFRRRAASPGKLRASRGRWADGRKRGIRNHARRALRSSAGSGSPASGRPDRPVR